VKPLRAESRTVDLPSQRFGATSVLAKLGLRVGGPGYFRRTASCTRRHPLAQPSLCPNQAAIRSRNAEQSRACSRAAVWERYWH